MQDECRKVLEQVEQIKPGTLDDVFKFDDRGKAGEVKAAVTSQVEESQENSQGPLQEAASADPGAGESPRVAGELDIEEPGAEPGSVRADRAMPPPRTESEIDMSAETVETENILKEACVTREFMDKHDDPVLWCALVFVGSLCMFQVSTFSWNPRYFVFYLPPLWLLAAEGVHFVARRINYGVNAAACRVIPLGSSPTGERWSGPPRSSGRSSGRRDRPSAGGAREAPYRRCGESAGPRSAPGGHRGFFRRLNEHFVHPIPALHVGL